jgi:mannonate dehydratase
VERLGAAGIRTVCYNFMPVFDWLRTDLERPLPDGSTTLAFSQDALSTDLLQGLSLPAWAEHYEERELREIMDRFRQLDPEGLWDNLARFLEAVVPVAEAAGVRLAIHPDDPPWSVFGLPRIITDADALRRFLDLSDSPSHGLTFCTGSLGSLPRNDLPSMAAEFADRIHFLHARSVEVVGPGQFQETAHPDGDTDLPAVLAALHAADFSGIVRPDHGRMIWGETGRVGYGLYDRALGAAYIRGVLDTLERGG